MSTDLHERGALDAPDDVAILDAETRTIGAYERVVKTTVDRVGAASLLVLLMPVLLVVALGVRAAVGKGVLYRQTRVGRNGDHFTLLKFRSMSHDRRGTRTGTAADRSHLHHVGQDRRITHKSSADPRVNGFGAFLRRYSLDELPQLINVLRGELSIIGPRPELATIVADYDIWQHRRHDVRPGLTGLWQVTERDGEGRMHLRVATDLEYINTLSFRNDLRILRMTPSAILRGDPEPAVA